MAIMINCANDFTYDLFVEDAKKYSATPMKGVYCRKNASDREKFMVNLKNFVRDFSEEWHREHNTTHDYADYEWIGNAFARELGAWLFSDYYKDTYNQRPHLDSWFYVTVLGLPHSQDVSRTFCSHPVEEHIEWAKELREKYEHYFD